MRNTQERLKARREYLKKGTAYTKASLTGLLAVPFALTALLFLIPAGYLFFSLIVSERPNGVMSGFGVFLLVVGLCFGVVSWVLAQSARKAHQEAKQIPYVPPVIAESLPVEEVLLRGSGTPAQDQRSMLLRATEIHRDTAEQDLLRGSSMEP